MSINCCVVCGSTKIAKGMKVISSRNDVIQQPVLEVLEAPKAVLLKKPKQFKLLANVCGECGNVQLVVDNPEGFWASFQKGQ